MYAEDGRAAGAGPSVSCTATRLRRRVGAGRPGSFISRCCSLTAARSPSPSPAWPQPLGARRGLGPPGVSEALYSPIRTATGSSSTATVRARVALPRRQLEMATLPLDLDDVLGELTAPRRWRDRPGATRMGHVHLQVSELPRPRRSMTRARLRRRRPGLPRGAVRVGRRLSPPSRAQHLEQRRRARRQGSVGLRSYDVILPDAASLERCSRGCARPGSRDRAARRDPRARPVGQRRDAPGRLTGSTPDPAIPETRPALPSEPLATWRSGYAAAEAVYDRFIPVRAPSERMPGPADGLGRGPEPPAPQNRRAGDSSQGFGDGRVRGPRAVGHLNPPGADRATQLEIRGGARDRGQPERDQAIGEDGEQGENWWGCQRR